MSLGTEMIFDGHGAQSGSSEKRSCHFYRERLHAYLELEVDAATARFLAAHLAECADCHAEKRALEAERIALLENLVDLPASTGDIAGRVLAEIRDHQARPATSRSPGTRRVALARVAAAVLVAGLLGMAFFESPGGGPDVSREDGELARIHSSLSPAGGAAAAPSRPLDEAGPELGTAAPVEESEGSHDLALLEGEVEGEVEGESDGEAAKTLRQLSATIISFHDSDPCSEDVNGDGELNPTDVAHAAFGRFTSMYADGPELAFMLPPSGDCDGVDCLY